MLEFLIIIFVGTCVTSAGASILTFLGSKKDLTKGEYWGVAFAIGFGVLGWAGFFIGVLGKINFYVSAAIILTMLPGVVLLLRPRFSEQRGSRGPEAKPLFCSLICVSMVAFGFDFVEAVAPVTEADTSAYHFDIAMQFAREGEISFIPRALSGAVPLLVQMTYTVVVALGDLPYLDASQMLNFWTLLSSWVGFGLLYMFSRRWLNPSFALAIAVIYQTMPTYVYGAGSGQVEARLGLMIIAVGVLVARCNDSSENLGRFAVIGLITGFIVGSKYTGLLFFIGVGAVLVYVILRRASTLEAAGKHILIFFLMAGGAGSQWYFWNLIHTGDPVFPMLFDWFGNPSSPYWSKDHTISLQENLSQRQAVISGIFSKLAYPWIATFNPPASIDSGRIGLGPFILTILPMSLFGAIKNRRQVLGSSLSPLMAIMGIYYVMWLVFGGIPKVRHLSPVIGPILLVLVVAAISVKRFNIPLIVSILMTTIIQISAHAFFTKSAMIHLVKHEDKNAFYLRHFGESYRAIIWINNNAEQIKHIMVTPRHFNYQIIPKKTFVHELTYGAIDLRPGHVSADSLMRGLCNIAVTHVFDGKVNPSEKMTLGTALLELERMGTVHREKTFRARRKISRSLDMISTEYQTRILWKLDTSRCHLSG